MYEIKIRFDDELLVSSCRTQPHWRISRLIERERKREIERE